MFGKIFAVVISAVLAASCVTAAVSANSLDNKDGKIYYTDNNGNKLTGWQTIDGNKYYFKEDGSAVTKNTTIDGKRYKFASDGKYLGTFTGWSKSGGNKYYYKKGVLQTGWITVKGKKYYAAKTGVIRTGWAAANGDIYYFDENGVWDGKTYKSWNHVYKPKTVGDFLLDFDYPDDALYEINFNDGKYSSFDNIELIREILKNESKTEFVFDEILSDDEVQEGLDYPNRNTIMIRSDPKQDDDKKMPHLKFSKDSSGNVYLYCPFYNFGCILDDNSVYDKLLAEISVTDRKSEITDETETAYISEDEINTLIQGRRQINALLMYSSLDFDTESKVSFNGFDYYRVIDEKYDEWNEWTDYVKSIYVDEASEMIFNDFKIIEINGKTYTNDGSAGNSISDEYTYEIVSETNDTVTILLKNTDNFTSETIETEIILVKTSNGWRIKNY